MILTGTETVIAIVIAVIAGVAYIIYSSFKDAKAVPEDDEDFYNY